MRARVGVVVFSLLLLGACSAAAPQPETAVPVVPVVESPLGAVNRAQDVANQVEQRQVDLEARLRDPFAQP